jgi:hypothetical protein
VKGAERKPTALGRMSITAATTGYSGRVNGQPRRAPLPFDSTIIYQKVGFPLAKGRCRFGADSRQPFTAVPLAPGWELEPGTGQSDREADRVRREIVSYRGPVEIVLKGSDQIIAAPAESRTSAAAVPPR